MSSSWMAMFWESFLSSSPATMRTEMVLKMSVYSLFNHLTWLLAWEIFTDFSHHETLDLIKLCLQQEGCTYQKNHASHTVNHDYAVKLFACAFLGMAIPQNAEVDFNLQKLTLRPWQFLILNMPQLLSQIVHILNVLQLLSPITQNLSFCSYVPIFTSQSFNSSVHWFENLLCSAKTRAIHQIQSTSYSTMSKCSVK